MFTEDDLISSYTRAQAIEDGTLVAVEPSLAREAGFIIPVAITQAAWADCVEWSAEDTSRRKIPQDLTGRLWDVLWMASRAAKRGGCEVQFTVLRVARVGRSQSALPVTLLASCGPGDQAEPVITIGFASDF